MRLLPGIFNFALLTCGQALRADTASADRPHVIAAPGGTCFFRSVPAVEKWQENRMVTLKEAFGAAYTVEQDGSFREIWRESGWHADSGLLSRDGRYLVRNGSWAEDQDNLTDLAVAFYDRGQLLKEYRVKDLLQKPELIEKSVSHYRWHPDIQSLPNGLSSSKENQFHLVLIDKTFYDFDITTGAILRKGEDKGAKSGRELRQEEDAQAREKGEAMFRKSQWSSPFQMVFSFSEIRAGQWSTSGVWFDGPEWNAELTPKNALPLPCLTEAVFPITADGQVAVALQPEEIVKAFQAALAHPGLAEWRKKAGRLRLRITGDRLHWNTPELTDWLRKATGKEPAPEALRDWAYFILGFEAPSYYLNTRTGELLYENKSPARELLHLDAAAQKIPVP